MPTPSEMLITRMLGTVEPIRKLLETVPAIENREWRDSLDRSLAWIEWLAADSSTPLPEGVPVDVLTKKGLYDYLWRGRGGQLGGAVTGGCFNTMSAGAYKMWVQDRENLPLRQLMALTNLNLRSIATLFYETQ